MVESENEFYTEPEFTTMMRFSKEEILEQLFVALSVIKEKKQEIEEMRK